MFAQNIAPVAVAFAGVARALPQAAYYSASATLVDALGPAPTDVEVHNVASHGPFTGTPTTTGALSLSVVAASIAPLPPNPTATIYPSDGELHDPEPAPYTPAGGLETNGTLPVYNAKSDFDYQSLVCIHLRC